MVSLMTVVERFCLDLTSRINVHSNKLQGLEKCSAPALPLSPTHTRFPWKPAVNMANTTYVLVETFSGDGLIYEQRFKGSISVEKEIEDTTESIQIQIMDSESVHVSLQTRRKKKMFESGCKENTGIV
ncbi:hypothetical protein AMECASPLE_002982 [Ameca splendens]|uniref:Uncharacterized protein n=1 Tax=Ameca splendens TaxID=208324 RepID=A0ABV1A632_9TELE